MPPHRKLFSRIVAPLAGLALASTCAHAAIIITPTGATSTSTIGSGGRVIGATIDGSGLSGSGDILTQTHNLNTSNTSADYWLSANGSVNQNDGINWWSDTEVITFTLPTPVVGQGIKGVHLWNYDRLGDNPTRALKSFDLSFSTDGGDTYTTTINVSGFLGPNSPGYTRVDDRIPVQSKFFAEQEGVTHIRMDNIFIQGSNAFMGFSEIRFEAVPEPTTALLGSLGLLALLRRRR